MGLNFEDMNTAGDAASYTLASLVVGKQASPVKEVRPTRCVADSRPRRQIVKHTALLRLQEGSFRCTSSVRREHDESATSNKALRARGLAARTHVPQLATIYLVPGELTDIVESIQEKPCRHPFQELNPHG